MFQNVSIPKGRCARKEKSQRQFSYANHITLFSLIPPEHCKLSVQNLQREKNAWNFFNLSINVLMWQNYDRRSYVTFLMGSVIIKNPCRLWLSEEVFHRYIFILTWKWHLIQYEQFRVNCLDSLIHIRDSHLKYIMYTLWGVHSSYKPTSFWLDASFDPEVLICNYLYQNE